MTCKQWTLIALLLSAFLTVPGPVHAYMMPPAKVLIKKQIQQWKFFLRPKRRLSRQRPHVHCHQKTEQSCEKRTSFDSIIRGLMLISGSLVTLLLIFGNDSSRRASNKLFLISNPSFCQSIEPHEEADRNRSVCADNPEPAGMDHNLTEFELLG